MPASARIRKDLVRTTAGLQVTCPSCRRQHRTGEISLVNGATGTAWCNVCLVDVTSPAERSALELANHIDDEIASIRLLARPSAERNAASAIVSYGTVKALENRLDQGR